MILIARYLILLAPITFMRPIFIIQHYLIDLYRIHSGACRNENDRYDDKGKGSDISLLACKLSCDAAKGCGAISWDDNTCYMTSLMASTTSESNWKCYSKGSENLYP